MVQLVTLGPADAGEVLTLQRAAYVTTLQRAAYVTEAQAHGDLALPPLVQSIVELADELADPTVTALGYRTGTGRLVAAVRVQLDAPAGVASIGRLIVAPDLQGQGLGTRLLGAVEAGLPAEVTELRLFTGEHSTGNLRLYTRLGYAEQRREPTHAGYALVHLAKHRPT